MEATLEHGKGPEYSRSLAVHCRILLFSAVLALMGLFEIPKLDAGIYHWIDENDVKNYSNKSPANEKNANVVFDEYPHDEVAHLIRLNADQERINALTEEINLEEQQASVDEQKNLEEANQNQPQLSPSECFSPSYNIQQGLTVFERIAPRYIGEGEYLDLQKLFQGLEGDWSGDGWVLSCSKKEGKVYEQMGNYSIRSEGIMRSSGQFILKSTLQSKERWTTEDKILRLYLSEKILSENPNLAVPNIELISASPDELVYVRTRKNRRVSGSRQFLEKVNTIKMTGEASFLVESIVYLGGSLKSISSWHLERR